MATFTPQQQHAVLCMLSYLVAFAEGSEDELQATMAEKLRLMLAWDKVQALIGRWEVVWGPVVTQLNDSGVADNTMFAAYSLDEPQMVISIAGTNPYSWHDWLWQDFSVRQKTAWPTYQGSQSGFKPKISRGTANGLRVLQAMRSEGQTLVEFLQAYVAAKVQSLPITVTGHSLGGALAPATAVYLADTQPTWDAANRAVVSVMPIAGPTPGNLDFAVYGEGKLNGRIQRIWNAKDIIPHAWDKAQMAELATLYAPAIKPTLLTRIVIKLAQWIANRADYAHLQPGASPLPGTVVPNEQIIAVLPPSLLNKLLPHFMLQMGYQHLEAYYNLLAMDEFLHLMGDKLPDAFSGPDVEDLRRWVNV